MFIIITWDGESSLCIFYVQIRVIATNLHNARVSNRLVHRNTRPRIISPDHVELRGNIVRVVLCDTEWLTIT